MQKGEALVSKLCYCILQYPSPLEVIYLFFSPTDLFLFFRDIAEQLPSWHKTTITHLLKPFLFLTRLLEPSSK
jgi:hypothetical protein